jgi:membrane protease YdiL (CAAX protease family)
MTADHGEIDREPDGDTSSMCGGGDDKRVIPLARPVDVVHARPWATPDPMRLGRISAGRAAIHLLILLAAFAVLITIISIIHVVMNPEMFAEDAADEELDTTLLMVMTIVGGFALSGVALVIMLTARLPAASLGLSSRSRGVDLALGVPVAIFSYAAFLMSYGVMYLVWPEGIRQLEENVQRIDAMMPDVHPWTLVLLMVAVATYEEILFRGFLLTHLRRITRSWVVAVLISSTLFAAMHIGDDVGSQNLATVVPLFAMGVVCSIFTIWRRSLIPAIVGHALFNSVQLVLLQFYPEEFRG